MIFNNFRKIDFLARFGLKAQIKSEINPISYWKFLIFIFIFGLMLILSLNIYFFWYLNKIETLGRIEQGVTEQRIRRAQLENVLQELNKRETELSRLMKEKTIINEP